MTIYVFYNNDPLASDQGGGAEHLRGLYRALKRTELSFKIVSSCMQKDRVDENVVYISNGANILRFFFSMILWFIKNRSSFTQADVFHFHRNYTLWPKYMILGRKGKTIITYHNHTGKKIEDWLGPRGAKLLRTVMLVFERAAVSIADNIIFVSDRVRQALKDDVIRNNFSKTVVIPAAFDSAAFTGCVDPSHDLAKKIIVIGRLASIKNFQLAISTIEWLYSQGHSYQLTIVGDGELRAELEKRVAESQCKRNITMYGLAQHSEVRGLISEHGIVLVSSKFEASPTIVKEAIASKRPVVTTDVGDVALWITEGANGYICEHTCESLGNAALEASKMILVGGYRQTVDLTAFSEEKIMDRVVLQYV